MSFYPHSQSKKPLNESVQRADPKGVAVANLTSFLFLLQVILLRLNCCFKVAFGSELGNELSLGKKKIICVKSFSGGQGEGERLGLVQ